MTLPQDTMAYTALGYDPAWHGSSFLSAEDVQEQYLALMQALRHPDADDEGAQHPEHHRHGFYMRCIAKWHTYTPEQKESLRALIALDADTPMTDSVLERLP